MVQNQFCFWIKTRFRSLMVSSLCRWFLMWWRYQKRCNFIFYWMVLLRWWLLFLSYLSRWYCTQIWGPIIWINWICNILRNSSWCCFSQSMLLPWWTWKSRRIQLCCWFMWLCLRLDQSMWCYNNLLWMQLWRRFIRSNRVHWLLRLGSKIHLCTRRCFSNCLWLMLVWKPRKYFLWKSFMFPRSFYWNIILK